MFLAAVAAAQNAVTPASEPTPTPTPEVKADPASVPADELVVQLVGACQEKPGASVPPECINGITKIEFERMVNLVSLPQPQQRQFANRMAALLAASNEAKRRGLQNTPEGQEWQKIFMLQALASALQGDIRKRAAEVPDADIQSYYNERQKEFRAGVFEKVTIPKRPGTKEKPAAPEEDKAFATKIRERWMAGEDPEKLQKEATERANPKATPPNVKVPPSGNQPVRSLPAADQGVFELKAGSFSELMSNANGFYVYKVISVETSKLEDKYLRELTVRDHIKQNLQQQRMQKMMEEVQNSSVISLNPKYFGPAPATPAFPGAPAGGRPGGAQMRMTPDSGSQPPANQPPVAPPTGSKGPQSTK